MKKRISLIAFFMFCVMIAGCGGKATSQQTAAQETADQETVAQETADQETVTQETAAQDTEEQPDSNQDVDVAISDVKHWKIEKGQLLGQTGPEAEDFIVFASLPTDSGIRDYAKVVSVSNNELFLIKQDCAFYRFDLTSNQATLITNGAYDSNYDSSDALYFVKPDETEYVIKDWKTADIEATATGNYRTNYNVCPNNYEVAGFDQFDEIQEAVKNGDYTSPFDKGYIVEGNGNIYDFRNHYITNVHLPEAYAGNIYSDGNIATIIKDGKLKFYRYGEELATIDLPDGSFVVADLSNVNVTSCLLYNFDDRSMYKVETGSVNKIFGEVKDYFAKDGQVFWVDGDNGGHVCHWTFDNNYVTVEDVKGVSHYRDFPGFVVDEDEEQGEEFNGLHILVY